MTAAQQSSVVAAPAAVSVAIPVKKIVPAAVLGAFVAALAFYFVGTEQGAASVFSGSAIHEFVHDARHLLGFPCH